MGHQVSEYKNRSADCNDHASARIELILEEQPDDKQGGSQDPEYSLRLSRTDT